MSIAVERKSRNVPVGERGLPMSVIWGEQGSFKLAKFQSEAELETAILKVQTPLFGPNRHYLDVKKKIGKGELRNVPDGYLLDLSGAKPRLYVVENELQAHDPLRHIAVQILQFSLSFESEPIAVKRVLLAALNDRQEAKRQCEQYVVRNGFRSLDYLLEYLVFESPFAALVVIDEMPENLENVLSEKFKFGVEVLELRRYENSEGAEIFRFDPFLADVVQEFFTAQGEAGELTVVDVTSLDTVVVPAREEGFQEVFLGENRWYAVRIHGSMRPQIKYIAAYQVSPVSAITYIAPVKSIETWKESAKTVLNFAEPARPIGPIRLLKGGRVKAPQNLRYTTKTRIENAKTLDDIWGTQQLT
jgi:regulator of RNase E activity RraB